MTANRRVVKNSIFVTGSVAIGGVLLFLIMIFIARYLGVEDYGHFSLLLTIISIVQLFADGGIVNITIRDIATRKHRLRQYVGSTTVGLSFISGTLLALTGLYVAFISDDPVYGITLLIMMAAAFSAMHALVFGAALRAMEDMQVTASIAIVHKAVLAVAVCIAIVMDLGIVGVAVAHLVANLWQLFVSARQVVKRYGKVDFTFNATHWKTAQKQALPLGAAMVLRKVTVHLDIILLTALATLVAVGLYSSAYRILQMIEVAVIAFSGVLFPMLSRLAQTDRDQFVVMYNEALSFLCFAAAPIAVWFVLAAEQLMMIFYGDEYLQAYKVLQILGTALIFLIPASLFNPMFAALHRQKVLMVIALISLTINLALDLLLIPWATYIGAALGTALTEGIICALGIYCLHALGVRFRCWWRLLRILFCALVAGVVYSALPQHHALWAELLRSVLFAGVYLAGIVITRAYTPADIKKLLKKEPNNRVAESG